MLTCTIEANMCNSYSFGLKVLRIYGTTLRQPCAISSVISETVADLFLLFGRDVS